MAKTDKQTPNRKKKPASADDLVKTDKTGKPELSEDELKNASGGSFSWGYKE